MRCIVCDYSDTDAKSLYNFSLVEPKGFRQRYVFYDRVRHEEICNVCYVPSNKKKVTKNV